MLFVLLSGQRGQTLYLINLRNIEFRDNTVVVRIGDLLKSSSTTIHSRDWCWKDIPRILICVF